MLVFFRKILCLFRIGKYCIFSRIGKYCVIVYYSLRSIMDVAELVLPLIEKECSRFCVNFKSTIFFSYRRKYIFLLN
jgi:hypothetical protein